MPPWHGSVNTERLCLLVNVGVLFSRRVLPDSPNSSSLKRSRSGHAAARRDHFSSITKDRWRRKTLRSGAALLRPDQKQRRFLNCLVLCNNLAELARPPALREQRRGTNKARVKKKKKEAKYYKSSVAPAALSPHSEKCNSISETPSRRSSFPSSRLQVR